MSAATPTIPAPVTVFSDYACPWCYLGYARLRRLLVSAGQATRPVRIVHFPLSPDTPTQGRDLLAYLRARGIAVQAAARLAELCEAEGLAYPRQLEGRSIWNTQRAQELAIWAAGAGESGEREVADPDQVERLHRRLFSAYHVDNLNLYDAEVLSRIAGEVGLDEGAARAAVVSGRYVSRRQDDWARALEAGVRGVPTFVVEGRALVGAQPDEPLLALLAQA